MGKILKRHFRKKIYTSHHKHMKKKSLGIIKTWIKATTMSTYIATRVKILLKYFVGQIGLCPNLWCGLKVFKRALLTRISIQPWEGNDNNWWKDLEHQKNEVEVPGRLTPLPVPGVRIRKQENRRDANKVDWLVVRGEGATLIPKELSDTQRLQVNFLGYTH